MPKAVIEDRVLTEIIQKSIENRLQEAMLDEGFMNALGRAASWVGGKLKQGANWVGRQINDFRNGYNVGSANNMPQNGNNGGGETPQTQDVENGPQTFPGLEQQAQNVNAKNSKPQKQYTEDEVSKLSTDYTNYIGAMKRQGYQYDSSKKKFVSGPDPNSLRQVNAKLTRLYKKWYNASEFSKKLDEIIGKVTKDVIDEIKRRNNILQ